MSEEKAAAKSDDKSVALTGLYAFKVGMTTLFDDNGESVPVTVLKYEPWIVSQVKTKEKDGYTAVQIACRPKRAMRTPSAEAKRMQKAGFEHGAQYVREIRQELPEGVEVGQRVDVGSLKKGDTVKVTGQSRGRGFS